ncbi:MAG TPA: DUF4129 domain-containing protein, partial [Chloroflexota bacterium]|nr:DUF4129 domain-containing protein [Chloroflexota bacterium]
LVFLVWDYSVRVAEEIDRLAFQPGDVESGRGDGASPAASPIATGAGWNASPYRFVSHARAWSRLMSYFVTGGFLVLIFAGLSLVSVEDLGDANRTEIGGVIPSVLLYYLLGLILASQASLDRLRTDWLRAGASVQPGLARRWLTYGLTLMLFALILALFLPTSFTNRAADELPGAWGVLWFVTWPFRVTLGALFGIIGWLFAHIAALLFAPVAGLLPKGPASAPPVVPPVPMVQAAPTPSPEGAAGFGSQWIWALLFYVAPSLLALYAIWNTWQKRHSIWGGLRAFGRDTVAMVWGAILDVAAVFWRFFGGLSPGFLARAPEQIKARWRKRQRKGEAALGEAPNWLRLRNLAPRALIVYFYTSLVQRATAVGWERRRGQTAYEYSRELGDHLPDRRDELQLLTDAFVRARYSRGEIPEEDARRARTPWQRIRDSLQTRRRAHQIASWFSFGKSEE